MPWCSLSLLGGIEDGWVCDLAGGSIPREKKKEKSLGTRELAVAVRMWFHLSLSQLSHKKFTKLKSELFNGPFRYRVSLSKYQSCKALGNVSALGKVVVLLGEKI